jgi:uncharacterized delta-60 repeat protein
VLQPDGRIVVAGNTVLNSNLAFALARYNSDGGLDTSFGTAGLVTSSNPLITYSSSLALQSDGRIVVAGLLYRLGTSQAFALTRYNSNGTLDTSFGSNGVVTTSFSSIGGEAHSVTVQPDGRIVAAGTVYYSGANGFALARYNIDGTLDTAFGSGGKVTTGFGRRYELANRVVVQPNGRIIAAGYSSTQGPFGSESFALARYDSDGSLDASFGTGGKVTTDFPGFTSNSCSRVVLQPDGQIVAAGSVEAIFNPYRFALARYEGDAAATSQTTLTSSASPSVYGQSVTFTASVTNGGQPVSAGSVAFADGSTVLGTVNLDPTGHAVYTTTVLTAADSPHQLTATYDGGGGGGPSSDTVQQLVTPAPLTITADDQTKVAGDPLPTLTASYSGFVNGDTPDSLTTPVSLSTYTGDTAGSYPIVASGATSANYTITFVNGTLTVNPNVAIALVLSGPSNATAGTPFTVTVTAIDAYGNVATGYLGTVAFDSDDPAAGLPDNYAFQPDDQGMQTFQVTLFTPGTQRVTVTDTSDPTLTGFLDVTVAP